MSAGQVPTRHAWRRLSTWVKLGLLINLLDITTSIPNAYNVNIGDRSQVALLIQMALVLPCFIWFYRSGPAAIRKLWTVALPPVVKVVVALILSVQLIQVFYQIERFPLTDVGMFTFVLPEVDRDVVWRYVYVEESEVGKPNPGVYSVRRTGDHLFRGAGKTDHRHTLGLVKFRNTREVADRVSRLVAQDGGTAPGLYHARVRFEPDGSVRIVELIPAEILPRGVRPLAVE